MSELEARAARAPTRFAGRIFVELVELLPTVGARRERNRPVRMQVIDVRKRKERMQCRVDRSRHAILAKRTQR